MIQFEHHQSREVTVEVFAPRQTEPKTFTWPLHWMVGQAAQQAANAFSYQGGTPTLGHENETFDRNKTLETAGPPLFC
jgi:hypothetical protein